MPRFKQVKDPSHDPVLQELYREMLDSGLGTEVPPNWFTFQGERPDIMAATWALCKQLLFHGMLPPTVKQMIAVVVSRTNECRYCTTTYANSLAAMEAAMMAAFTNFLNTWSKASGIPVDGEEEPS
jgi:alkylhydroperoxidase/carboxymuconolactone decarboxylase family protein YurZ